MASGIELAHRKALKAMQYICQTSKGCCNTATEISQFFAAIGWLGACVSQERQCYSLIILENRTQVLITLENQSQILHLANKISTAQNTDSLSKSWDSSRETMLVR